MDWYSFNGQGYDIHGLLPPYVKDTRRLNWRGVHVHHWCHDHGRQPVEGFIGFSRGSWVALRIAQRLSVKYLILHSVPLVNQLRWKMASWVSPPKHAFLFSTENDLTPCAVGTKRWARLLGNYMPVTRLVLPEWPWLPEPTPGTRESRMALANHQFHNCLPALSLILHAIKERPNALETLRPELERLYSLSSAL